MNTVTISRMQPVGDAASELAKLLHIGHGDAVLLLVTADSATIAYTDNGDVIQAGHDDIAYTVTITKGDSEDHYSAEAEHGRILTAAGRDARIKAETATATTIDTATTADELLTALASIKPEYRVLALGTRGVKILREAADLCGVADADTLGKRSAINAIVENF